MKTTYQAQFADGQQLRRATHRTYTVAWRIQFSGQAPGVKLYCSGFSANRASAVKAASRCLSGLKLEHRDVYSVDYATAYPLLHKVPARFRCGQPL